jgi:hypothetical protein
VNLIVNSVDRNVSPLKCQRKMVVAEINDVEDKKREVGNARRGTTAGLRLGDSAVKKGNDESVRTGGGVPYLFFVLKN